MPMILERARAGRLVRIGKGDNLVDVTYIEDCVNAHVLAMKHLESGAPGVAGRAYFISQGEPIKLWDWINELLNIHGLPPVTRSINYGVALTVAGFMETAAKLSFGLYRPLFTKFLIRQMAKSHYFSIQAAQSAFGYVPRYTIASAYSSYRTALAA